MAQVGAATSGSMGLFVHSADTQMWKKWLPTGVFRGVTTNPLLLRESNVACQIKSLNVLSNQALRLGAKEIHHQAWGTSLDALVRNGSELASIDNSIVVHIPATYTGLRSARKLKDMGARIGLIIYSVHQALLALGIGAEYVAFDARKVASEEESKENISSIQNMVRGTKSATRLLVANPVGMEQLTCLASLSRVNSFALSPSIIDQLFTDTLTEQMVKEFEAAASKNNFTLFL